MRSMPSNRKASLPEITSKRSSWNGWMWSGPVVHPGSPIQSTWSNSPYVSGAVFLNTVLSPVTGLTSSSPAFAMSFLLRLVPVFSQYLLEVERDREQGSSGQGGEGPQVVPRGPLREVIVPIARGALRVQFREPVVERDVAYDRHTDSADEVERAA